jgi:general L-amino acid transport system permease protein
MKPDHRLLSWADAHNGTYIAEIVRAGILAVTHGQTERPIRSASSGRTLRLVIIPQRDAGDDIPPLTSQYLNLTKNSLLAVAIGYPDLVSVFSGRCSTRPASYRGDLIPMLIYLTISLTTALFMNWFNHRFALVER